MRLKTGLLLFCCLLFFFLSAGKILAEENKEMKLYLSAEGKVFELVFYDTAAAGELTRMFPLKALMRDFNGNEKYCDLQKRFTADKKIPKEIKCGDIMLYGGSTLVIFYKDFSNPGYSYTPIGTVRDRAALAEIMKKDTVAAEFFIGE